MNKKLLILNFLFFKENIATNNIDNYKLNIETKKKFDEHKDFYKKLFIEFFNKFDKNDHSFERKKQYILFIKEYFKTNNKTLKNGVIEDMIKVFQIINLEKNNIKIDWNNGIIGEINEDPNKLIKMVHIWKLSEYYSFYELYTDKEITEEEFTSHINNWSKDYSRNITAHMNLASIIQIVNFKDLEENITKYKNKISKFKDDKTYQNLLKDFMNTDILSDDLKENINNNIWYLIEFVDNIYTHHYTYINSKKKDFNSEVEIIKKIIAFKKSNNFFENLTYYNIYDTIIDSSTHKIEKINNKYYIFKIYNENEYLEKEIVDLEFYKKYEVFVASLLLMTILLGKNNKNLNNKSFIQITGYFKYFKPVTDNYFDTILTTPTVKKNFNE
jgi:hypothetical protein